MANRNSTLRSKQVAPPCNRTKRDDGIHKLIERMDQEPDHDPNFHGAVGVIFQYVGGKIDRYRVDVSHSIKCEK